MIKMSVEEGSLCLKVQIEEVLRKLKLFFFYFEINENYMHLQYITENLKVIRQKNYPLCFCYFC